MAAGDYALGLEPSNCYVEGRERQRNVMWLNTIKPLEKIRYFLKMGVLDGETEIRDFVSGIGGPVKK
jgi:hypothetical protein